MIRLSYYNSAIIGAGTRFSLTTRIDNILGKRESVEIGRNCMIDGELVTFKHGGGITIGDWCYVGAGSRIWSAECITIGNRVLISHNVNIHDCDSHPLDADARHAQFRAIATSGHPRKISDIASTAVTIGDDVWIGFNAIILKGVTIGARSIVAASSIVTHDIPSDSIFIGNRVTRNINEKNR